jgi:hypothetical protein
MELRKRITQVFSPDMVVDGSSDRAIRIDFVPVLLSAQNPIPYKSHHVVRIIVKPVHPNEVYMFNHSFMVNTSSRTMASCTYMRQGSMCSPLRAEQIKKLISERDRNPVPLSTFGDDAAIPLSIGNSSQKTLALPVPSLFSSPNTVNNGPPNLLNLLKPGNNRNDAALANSGGLNGFGGPNENFEKEEASMANGKMSVKKDRKKMTLYNSSLDLSRADLAFWRSHFIQEANKLEKGQVYCGKVKKDTETGLFRTSFKGESPQLERFVFYLLSKQLVSEVWQLPF